MSDLIAVSLIAAVSSTIASVLSFVNGRRQITNHAETTKKMDELTETTNGKMAQLLRVTGASEHAKGVIEGNAGR